MDKHPIYLAPLRYPIDTVVCMIESGCRKTDGKILAMKLPTPMQTLDLRTTKCPLNFVKTRLALEKLAVGDILEIWILLESQSAINIPQSIAQEGHVIIAEETDETGLQRLFIRRCAAQP